MRGWSKKALSFSGMLFTVVAAWSCTDHQPTGLASAGKPAFGTSTTGNGAPSGAHYNLNIIGVPQDKTASMTGNNGGRIFVQLYGGDVASDLNGTLFGNLKKVNKIFLVPAPAGESFQVLDANATDADGATFQLPIDVSSTYTVWARGLGKPGGYANQTTCATTTGSGAADTVICSLNTLTVTRTKGDQKFTNVSADLLFITINVGPTTLSSVAACLGITTDTQVTLPLFNPCLENWFWNYDNHGLHLLQLRFYQM